MRRSLRRGFAQVFAQTFAQSLAQMLCADAQGEGERRRLHHLHEDMTNIYDKNMIVIISTDAQKLAPIK